MQQKMAASLEACLLLIHAIGRIKSSAVLQSVESPCFVQSGLIEMLIPIILFNVSRTCFLVLSSMLLFDDAVG